MGVWPAVTTAVGLAAPRSRFDDSVDVARCRERPVKDISSASAMPCPPPMHSVTMPRFSPSRRIECSRRVVSTAPGCADRMAVRDGATLDVDDVFRQPSSRRTASGTAANASLISTRSTSPSASSGRDRALAGRRAPDRCRTCRARPPRLRTRPGAPIGASPSRSAKARSATIIAAAPLLRPGRIARRDRAVLAERRLQLGERVDRGVRPIGLVLIEDLRAFATFDFDADDLCGEAACCLRGSETLLRALGPPILVVARDVVAAHQILGVPARVLTRKRVIEPVAQHAVENLASPMRWPQRRSEEVGRLIHVLHATGDRDVGRGRARSPVRPMRSPARPSRRRG